MKIFKRSPYKLHRRIKWFIQRGQRGWSDRDTWGFDIYLAEVLASGLVYLRDNLHGHPVNEDTCNQCLSAEEHECKGFENWKNILNEMIEGFELLKADDEWFVPSERREEYKQKTERAKELLVKYWGSLWD